MVVLVLTACPEGLRGHLTRWLLEVSSGVYVGHVSARVREQMWLRVLDMVKDGKALMVYSVRGEQRLAFKVHRHHWEPADFDGLLLMRRPADGRLASDLRAGWSKASRYRRARARK